MQHHSETMTSVEQPLCPKPRRVCSSLPDFLKPLSCSLHSSNCQQSSEGRSSVLNIADKVQPIEGGTIDWYAGSPPKRTGNPLVHDLHFVHCLDLLPNFSSTKEGGDTLSQACFRGVKQKRLIPSLVLAKRPRKTNKYYNGSWNFANLEEEYLRNCKQKVLIILRIRNMRTDNVMTKVLMGLPYFPASDTQCLSRYIIGKT